AGHEWECLDRRPGLFDRLDIHEKDHAGRILAVPELLDLAVEVMLERSWHLVRHDLLPLLGREGLHDRSDSHDFHELSPCLCDVLFGGYIRVANGAAGRGESDNFNVIYAIPVGTVRKQKGWLFPPSVAIS